MAQESINKALSDLFSLYEIDKQVGIESKFLAQYILSTVNALSELRGKFIAKEEKGKLACENQDKKDFVERMYQLYPSKCPVRNTYLGKSQKDKDKISRLLKKYTIDEIEKVIRYEVETKYGKSMMSNFSTFLNNFPDPNALDEEYIPNKREAESKKQLVINGVIYR